jgi:hypothetical protein
MLPLLLAFLCASQGLTTWSPLASGILTGKYSGGQVPEGSRFSVEAYKVGLACVSGGGLGGSPMGCPRSWGGGCTLSYVSALLC